MSGPALRAADLRVERNGRAIAALANLEVAPGEGVGLVGRNGAGKSTLLRALALLEPTDAGVVALSGQEVPRGGAMRERLRRDVTLVLPEPHLFRGTVEREVRRGLAARDVPRADAARRGAAVLESLGGSHLAGRDTAGLSSGETARVALARALVLETPVLLLDEALAHLDPEVLPLAVEAVRRRMAAGTAVVIAAVRVEDVHGLAGRVVEVLAVDCAT